MVRDGKRHNPSRQLHFIPKVLLKNFQNDGGKLWCSSQGNIFRVNWKKVFRQRDLYAKRDIVPGPGGSVNAETWPSVERSYEHEDTLTNIENAAEEAIKRIILQARRGNRPQLSRTLDVAWKSFVMALARRTPESQNRLPGYQSFDQVYYEAARHVAHEQDYPLPDMATLYQEAGVPKLKDIAESNSRAAFAAGEDPHMRRETARFCRETGLRVVVIPIPGQSFAIGSHGLTIISPSYERDFVAASWIPVAHDVAVGVTRSPQEEALIRLSPQNSGHQVVAAINRSTARMSSTMAGRSESLIRSLAKYQS